ncbi:hypothetical protein [Methylobacterium sp.]|uniref:hypothetical protein n=1 Tax=Methylobacterium sp. TaxID=409 RepID=UPI0025EFA16B|nr:hypothetical protein [Methylobacterium sp.]MBY0259590.1 hypothetical protein [Methylobacterium sp.]
MRRLAATVVFGVALVSALAAQTGFTPWKQADGSNLSGMVLLCDTGVNRIAMPCGGALTPMTVLSTPFVRSGTGDPIIFDGVSTVAKQFAITKPADATSYRFVNPCSVDVRIRKVANMQESVTLTTGTRFMARSVETLGTSQPTYVSIIATAAPTGECAPELQYGRGG